MYRYHLIMIVHVKKLLTTLGSYRCHTIIHTILLSRRTIAEWRLTLAMSIGLHPCMYIEYQIQLTTLIVCVLQIYMP